ncbi:MAG: hypothetical protein DCC67_08440 [Planctomycetota bacterium]|nr:MAG: hypothetical protein DCC67_08440 [Planctomycetota bacterium]
MLLYIIRHADAYEHGDPRWPDDSQRPLEDRGAERFANAVRLLAERDLVPDVVAASPYLRCLQTAEIVARFTEKRPLVIETAALRPASDLEAMIAWSSQHDARAIAWVGHAPDVNRMAAILIGDSGANLRFAKGAIAAIRFRGSVEKGEGELCWLATAKLLGV